MSTYTREELAGKGVRELRTLARDHFGGGTWIAAARKKELIEALVTGGISQSATAPAAERRLTRMMLRSESLDFDMEELITAVYERVYREESIRESASVQPLERRRPLKKSHHRMGALIAALRARQHVVLTGPVGGGKTTASLQAAHSLDLPFYSVALTSTTTEEAILGRVMGDGYRASLTRVAYEHGGLLVVEGTARGSLGILELLASFLASERFGFPDRMVQRHEDFVCVINLDTEGRGSGQAPVEEEASVLDLLVRHLILEWDYDENLERELSTDEAWTDYVQGVRRAVDKLGIDHVVTPDASIKGSRLLQEGMDRELVKESLLWRGLDPAVRKKIQSMLV